MRLNQEEKLSHWTRRFTKFLPLAGLAAAVVLGCGGQEMSAQELFEVAQSYQASGRLDDAVLKYTETIRLDPEMTAAYVNRGNVKLQLGAYGGALLDYQKALQFQPNHFSAIFNSGIIHFLEGDFALALEQYDRALALDPGAFDAYINRGTLYFAMGRHEDAIREFTVVIEKGNEPEHAYYSRGDAYFDLGEFEDALADYDHVESNPYTPLRQWIAYQRLERPGDADRALSDYFEALDMDTLPTDVAAIYDFFSGNIDEERLVGLMDDFESKGNKESVVTLCFYLGSAKSVEGDEAAARSYFERGTRDKLHTVSEYASMKHLLATMDAPGE